MHFTSFILINVLLLHSASATHKVGSYKNGNKYFVSGTGKQRGRAIGKDLERSWNERAFLSSSTTRLGGGARSGLRSGEQCYRDCANSTPTICYFEWYVERYSVLGPACRNCSNGIESDCFAVQCVLGDGFQRGVITANRQLGGPSIQVCVNDLIVVEVHNEIPDEGTAIHWHGVRQYSSPYMDGVPMVTQCPIQPSTTFTYVFEATDAGTFFWHAHQGTQKLDGLTGAVVVRDSKKSELHGHLYDEDRSDHVIFVQDWTHLTADQYVPGIHSLDTVQLPDAVLINGFGRISNNGTNPIIPIARFNVERGKRYRFRLIAGTCKTCAYAFKIQGHRLLAISADGGLNFKPTPVDSIAINSGDRFDFILEANQTADSYYMYVQTINTFCNGIRQVAVLQYSTGANSTTTLDLLNPPPTGDLGIMLNFPNSTCSNNTSDICVHALNGEENAPRVQGSNRPYYQYHVTFGTYLYEVNDLFVPGIYDRFEEPVYDRLVQYLANNISFKFPPSPLLSQWGDIPSSAYCSRECYSQDIDMPCTCTNVYRIPLEAIVDIIVIDTGERDGFNHPFHLHGYNFYVLEMGVLSQEREERQREIDAVSLRASRDKVVLRSRPQRDTISIPARGYAVLRFIADNPGYWLLHCHFLYHLENGMALVFKVGKHREMPPVPRGFPRCGNFYAAR